MSGYSRGNPRMGDVLRSVLVLGGVVLLFWFVGQRLFATTPEHPTADVDWQTAASGVPRQAGFVALAPASLPEGWRATTARVVDGRWQLGLVTDDDEYVGVSQATTTVDALVRDRVPDSKAAGDVEIDGVTWQRRTGPDGDFTVVRADGEQAVLVTGSATRDVVEDLAGSLRPYSS